MSFFQSLKSKATHAFGFLKQKTVSFFSANKKRVALTITAVTTFLAAKPSFAINTSDIDAAFESGKTALGSVSTGTILMTGVVVGLGLILAFMRK